MGTSGSWSTLSPTTLPQLAMTSVRFTHSTSLNITMATVTSTGTTATQLKTAASLASQILIRATATLEVTSRTGSRTSSVSTNSMVSESTPSQKCQLTSGLSTVSPLESSRWVSASTVTPLTSDHTRTTLPPFSTTQCTTLSQMCSVPASPCTASETATARKSPTSRTSMPSVSLLITTTTLVSSTTTAETRVVSDQ